MICLYATCRTHLARLLFFVLFLSAIALSPKLFAQNNTPDDHQDFEKYSVYYTLFNSTFIQPDIAKLHNIKRSKYENLLNISISHKGQYGALPAKINGTVTNLMQQQKPLKIIEISEQTATYYLIPLRVTGKEILHFNLQVIPTGESKPLNVKFTKTIYAE